MELLRPTAPAEAPDADGPVDEDVAEGRGDASGDPQPGPKRVRRAKATPAGKTRARNLHLSDDVHDRLWLLARQRKQTVSAVADDLLNKALPRWEIKRQG
jgi:hypothetical protein